MKKLYAIKDPAKESFQYVYGGFYYGGQPNYVFSAIDAYPYTKEDAEETIRENKSIGYCVIELLPDNAINKISEGFGIAMSIIIFWRKRRCNYCGSRRVYQYKNYYDDNLGLSSAGENCHRCHRKNWSWRD